MQEQENVIQMSDGELVTLQDQLQATPIGAVSPAVRKLLNEIDAELDRRRPGENARTAEGIVTRASQLPDEIAQIAEGSSNVAVNAGIGGVLGFIAAKILKGSGGMGVLAGVIAGAVLQPFGDDA